ncbi:DoxX family protein [Mangrovicoccus algicola]|uniref:DoxX family protein n=1 Tax=Mangrovicoccus algicola TaxID=2771008 RepID=A0A8J7CVB0_9RHOB|nr:DoxX family protein [Mangrovicoccus algicola]MBE3638534.1 DoxX family protein [Mangrovicoccus algicola]
MFSFLSRFEPYLLSVLRAVTGLLFVQHGFTKLLGWPRTPMSDVAMSSLPGIAGLFEFAGGLLLIAGLFTRPTAFVLSGMMAVAYFTVHAPQGFFPIVNGGELAATYCFVFLYFCVAGPGPWSLDAKRAGR